MEVNTSLTKNKIMTVEQRLSNLETSYIKWSEKENGFGCDAGYVWWEREKDCQEWSNKEKMTPLIVHYVMKNPKWKISLQTHKYLNIP